MNKEDLTNKIIEGVKNSFNESKHLNEYAWNDETQTEHVEEKDLLNLSASDIKLFHIAFDSLTNILIENGVRSQEEAEEYLPSVFKDVFDRIPRPLEVLTYLRKCMHIDWESLVDLDCTDVDSLESNYFEFATRAWFKAQNSVNESKTFDPRNNKDHKAAYNSFVKWFDRWKGKLDRNELRAMIKKVSADALGDNLDAINESRVPARIEDADQHMAHDIFLTYENTREIYDHFITPMADNLLIKLRKGKELSFDVLVNSSIIERHAKAAIDEYKRMNGRIMVDTATRKALKTKIAQYLINLANDDYAFELHDMESNLHK